MEWFKGRLNIDIVKENLADVVNANYYFCGPTALTESLSEGLMECGVSEESLHAEEFISPTSLSEEDIPHVESKITLDGKVYQYSGKKTSSTISKSKMLIFLLLVAREFVGL